MILVAMQNSVLNAENLFLVIIEDERIEKEDDDEEGGILGGLGDIVGKIFGG